MSGILEILDVNKVSEIYSDYLGLVNDGNVSPDGIAWVKNAGDSPFSSVEIELVEFPSNNGIFYTKIGLGNPLGNPQNLYSEKHVAAGNIGENITRYYVVAAVGVAGGPSVASISTTIGTAAGESNIGFYLMWDAVANALGYIIYSSINGTNFYELATTLNNTYLDQTGLVNSGNAQPVSQNQAYRAGAYGTEKLVIGNLDPGSMIPIFYRAEIPDGTTSLGNRRRVKLKGKGYSY